MQFSVVTPSFRQLDWLSLCAASIADQGVDAEHIVQDAGSAGIEDWIAQHASARVIVEKDAGMYDAINRGLRQTTGDILSYLNSDEQYLPQALRLVGDFFSSHPEVDVLFGDAVVADVTLQPVAYRRMVVPLRWHTLLRPLGILTCSTFFRRKVIEDGHFFDPEYRIIGDKAWLYALHTAGYRMAVLPRPLAVFALTGENLSGHKKVAEEVERWRTTRISPGMRLLRPLAQLHNGWRRWRSGGYGVFEPELSYYTPGSRERVTFAKKTLRVLWPQKF